MILKLILRGVDVDRIRLAQDGDKQQAPLDVVMKLLVP